MHDYHAALRLPYLLRRARLILVAVVLGLAAGVPAAAAAGDRPACPDMGGDTAHCYALVATTASGVDAAIAAPVPAAVGTPPYGPAAFHAGYSLPTTAPAGQTIAIVDAFDDPKAESDLGVYSTRFGLPACTTANGCFRKVNQRGGTTPPATNVGWGLEISLDVDVAHAICQNCKILLVEADTNSLANLAAAVNRAAVLGATVISNSYGGRESGASFAAYNHPRIAVVASSGDNGFAGGTQFPASAPTVVAVGGTTLHLTTTGAYSSESVWKGAGSGCSAFYNPQPWQSSLAQFPQECPTLKRGVADLSADADPATGAAVYDSFGEPGWVQVGGTSLSSPLVAAVFALAGNASTVSYPAQLVYAHPTLLHDVLSGSNGACGGGRICTAKPGLDGPTGLGTPKGLGAF